jgi:membrane-bound lytic murein transglycosylase D
LLKRHALPKETSGYVPIILAMTIMAKNPSDYGLEQLEVDSATEWDTIHLTATTNLNLIADATLQPVSVLRDLNPALLRSVAPAGFDVHLPKGSSETVQAALDSIPASNREAWRIHHVASGDTLAAIARSYNVTAEQIASVNPASDSIEAGEALLIPAVYHEERTATSRKRTSKTTAVRARGNSLGRAAHVASSRNISPQVLHRRASVRTASLRP